MASYMFSAPLFTVEILGRLINMIPQPRLNERRDPNRFTPREQIAHLADWEPIFQERIRGAVEQDNFVVTPYDEGERALSENYGGQDVHEAFARFRAERERTVAYATSLSREQLLRPLTHPEIGPLTVVEIIAQLSQHDTYHIEDLMHYCGEKTAGTW